MYYINNFFIYSVMGFILESVVYKYHNANKHSSIFYGPYTVVYGLGGILILLINKYISPSLTIDFIKPIILYIILVFILTFIEYLDGNLIYKIFKIDMWNYSNHKYHFGKYICLDLALIWGLLGTLIIYFVIPFTNGISALINDKGTITLGTVFIIDLIFTIIKRRIKNY